MAWFADLAGKAENLLINFDEQTGAALRNHNVVKQKKHDRHETSHPDHSAWNQKKRTTSRSLKTVPHRKSSPVAPPPSTVQVKEISPRHKSPTRKLYSLHHCPRTLVGDLKDHDMETYGYKPKRLLPTEIEKQSTECLTYRVETVAIENSMLKNELNVTNREIKELLDRLHRTEDGEAGEPVESCEPVVESSGTTVESPGTGVDSTDTIVDNSAEELGKTNTKLEHTEINYRKASVDKESLLLQLEQLKSQLNNITTNDITRYKEQKREFETEIAVLRERNKDLEELVKLLKEKSREKDNEYSKMDNDLRHAHSTINVLQGDLGRSNGECKRLEREWESYKHRVKSMLAAKDKEIKALQQGVNFTEDTKILMEQIEHLKEEREVLSEAVNRVRGECGDMKQYMETLESRHNAAERVVIALRDALKDERAARTRAEAQCNSIAKELKSIQIETGQTIASLRNALRDKEQELLRVRDSSTSCVRTSDSSALNVADYDVSQASEDSDKLYFLTQKLVQKQGKIDLLMADNNMLKIQLDKLESKRKLDQSVRGNSHSVVHVQDGDRTRRVHTLPVSSVSKASRWLGGLLRRYPVFRGFIFAYMVHQIYVFTFGCLLSYSQVLPRTPAPKHFTSHSW
ncbi:golgin subfamily A member 5 isoform X2 [Pectinophora gossypiella]|uniref:golgin subfamily A member 5 isoform X2 n=1 Tax=Pectinophora gossypiella TaxID=13191 RepID=UPI00214F2043|nr:golgin subfamily A member 5 isoform X2 [Pectinophora gossypiella]